MQDTVTSRELFERMPTRPALAEPEVAAHKVRSYEDDSTDWAPSGGRAAAPEQPAQPARRRPVRSTPALCANVLDEFVRALLPQLDLTSGGPARGLHAPPGPNGLLRGRHVPPALLPHIVLLPRVSFPSLPSAHKEFAVDS